MEKIRRALKIFWTEHGIPILFWTIVFVIVFVIIQLLNNYSIKQNEKNNNTQVQSINIEQQNIYQENEEYTTLINQFIECLENEQIEQAYVMLSENCKKDLYPTVEDFSTLYYNRIFNQNRDIELEYDATNDIYQVIFYEDILESGKIENRDSIEDQYKIEKEILENKIYINYNKSIK